MRFVLVTAPAVEPVSLAELKAHVAVEHDLDDALLTAYGLAARTWAENFCRRAFVSQTWQRVLDGFPAGGEIQLGKGTLRSVSGVTYVDLDGATQTLDTSTYLVDDVSVPGWVRLVTGESWPDTDDRPNAVRVTFVAGFGDTADDVPDPIKAAIKMLTAHFYAMREPEITGTIVSKVGFAVEALLSHYRLPRFA